MKVVGIVLAVFGGLMLLSSARVAITTYDLNSTHDISKLFGGAAVSCLILLGGVLLIRKASGKT